jgi:hypothetical protein
MTPKDSPGVRDGNENPYGTGREKSEGAPSVNASPEQLLIEKVRALPPERRAEVEDFIDFLQGRVADQRLVDAAITSSKPAFDAVWDNDQDEAYDRL